MSEALKPAHQIERYKVDSGTIAEIGYENGVCVIEFHTGALFAYPMAAEHFQQFALAESKGRYFNQNIRGKLAGTKLTGKCANCGSEPEIIGVLCSDCGTGEVRAIDKQHKEAE